jgi:hypothetical protein
MPSERANEISRRLMADSSYVSAFNRCPECGEPLGAEDRSVGRWFFKVKTLDCLRCVSCDLRWRLSTGRLWTRDGWAIDGGLHQAQVDAATANRRKMGLTG